ncbi:MAG TPA: hypothetical protein VFS94_10670 [Gemmatimonadales bacterium]|nr:hypothetical protein [Gemmatimonadales bacterium]
MSENRPGGPSPVAIAASQNPVQLRAGLIDDDRTPSGMVCMATWREEKLVARCVLPPETWEQIDDFGLLADPVQVVLLAREAPPGLQCQLFAIVPLPEDLEEDEEEDDEEDDDTEEPWAASVPSSAYEKVIAEEEEDEEEDEPRVATLPLGTIVRYSHDRVHPDSLPHEAADVLRKVIEGQTAEMVDRALSRLFDEMIERETDAGEGDIA